MKHAFLFIFGLWLCLPLLASENKSIELNHDSWKRITKDVHYETSDKKAERKLPEIDFAAPGRFDLTFLRPILFTFIIVLIVIVLVVILRNTKSPNQLNKQRIVAESIEEAEENLPEVELDNIYNKALQQEDYRSALRVKFLMILQRLIDARVIEWKKRKTNEQYISEIRNPNFRLPFSNIVMVFDDTWYGNTTLTEPVFNEVSLAIESFQEKIPGK